MPGTHKLTDADSGSGEAGHASQVIENSFPLHATENVLVQSPTASVPDPAFQTAIRDMVARVEATNLVTTLRSPLDPADRGQVAADAHSALVQFDIVGDLDRRQEPRPAGPRRGPQAAARNPGIAIAETGDASMARAISDTIGKDFQQAEKLSIPITLLILLFAFGAIVAALLPLGLSFTAILAASGLLALTSHLSPVSARGEFGHAAHRPGRGRGLLAVLREAGAGGARHGSLHRRLARRGRRHLGTLGAGQRADRAHRDGRHVLRRQQDLNVFAQATMLVVAVAVVGSLTVLPAMLSLLGDRVERGRIPWS